MWGPQRQLICGACRGFGGRVKPQTILLLQWIAAFSSKECTAKDYIKNESQARDIFVIEDLIPDKDVLEMSHPRPQAKTFQEPSSLQINLCLHIISTFLLASCAHPTFSTEWHRDC